MDGRPTSKICPTCERRYDAGASVCVVDGDTLLAVGLAPADPLLDAILGGKFRIMRGIGQGGMGKVYEAQHVA